MNNSRMELHVVAFLEMLNIPYTGASPKCIGVTYDKQAVLKVAESIGVPVPKSVYVEEGAELDPSTYGLEWPIMVKPNSTDGSFGITQRNVCHNMDNLKAAMEEIRNVFHIRGPVLYQEYLTGRDVNVGVMEQRNLQTGEMEPQTLPITEEDYSALPEDLPKICGFESKWDESSPYYKIVTRPTTLSEEAQRLVSQHSVRLFRRIDCHDYARFDWRLDGQGRPRLLEANPNCGWCWDGHLPKTAALCGVSYAQFFETIIKSGLDRAAKLAMQAEQNKVKKFINVGRNGAEELMKKAVPLGSSTSPTGSDMSIPEH
jgi:D-alanine-D-alanine ligase